MKKLNYILIAIISILAIFVSCDVELEFKQEGESINELIYPYLKFDMDENGKVCSAVVVEGAAVEKLTIPGSVGTEEGTVKVDKFLGFENPEDAENLKTIVIESPDVHIPDGVLDAAVKLESCIIKNNKWYDKWSYLPELEKEGMEFLGWFAGGVKVEEGMLIDPNFPVAEPKWRNHTYIEHEGKEPTCTEAGWKPYVTCETCDYSTYEEIPALGHDYIHVEAVEPTCTEGGKIEHYECSRCGLLFTEKDPETKIDDADLPPLGHSLQHFELREPTCFGIGYKEHEKCSVCGKYFVYENSELVETSWNDLVLSELPPHTWETKFNQLEHWIECKVCHRKDNVEKHEWTFVKWNVVPTEQYPGEAVYECVCGAEKTVSVAPENHNFIEIEGSYIPATCTTDGKRDWICTDCGMTYTEVIPATGHSPEYKEAVAPTCQKEGNIAHWYCPSCGGYFSSADCSEDSRLSSVKKDKVDHDFSGDWVITGETHARKCIYGCGMTSTPKSHNYEKTVAEKRYLYSDADCFYPAKYYKSCECGAYSKKYSSIFTSGSAKGHDFPLTEVPRKENTCTEDGNIQHWKCERCGTLFADEEGHQVINKADTVIKACHDTEYVPSGNGHILVCKRCKEQLSEVLPHKVAWLPSPENPDYFHYDVCLECNKKLGHSGAHNWITVDGKVKCSICEHEPKDINNTQGEGGFDVTPNDPTPLGKINVKNNGDGTFTLSLEIIKSKTPITGYEWFVDGEKQENCNEGSFVFKPKYPVPYQVMCVFKNEGFMNSDSVSVKGMQI